SKPDCAGNLACLSPAYTAHLACQSNHSTLIPAGSLSSAAFHVPSDGILFFHMREHYRRWIHDWESRMTSRDNNRVVRPFEWGPGWTEGWPVPETLRPPQGQTDKAAMLDYWLAVNDHLVANSDQFYAYKPPTDFRVEHRKVELFHTGSEPPKKQPKD